MIAVPTNNLKSELVQKIGRDKVLEIPSFEDLPLPPELRQTIEKNYSMGFINDALESIKTYAHNSKDNSINNTSTITGKGTPSLAEIRANKNGVGNTSG